ncbi:MAG: P-II family nitrogen regulator [Saprospiraceae bacterium]|nr:P-II family nitrogen regulator [Saprospiraceae bacterium]MBK7371809.1 P-II family nitrogen regulator [Saprospiraceae bacterium]MBK8513854.1 P-II family nitrogen regulator [Saprospiraceae bacterium]MBK9677832.1 P-II family nitrogen regulator [Saprospiraceae bacterium]MBK9929797.1 P-II family nitrogen regulator [Saprospiraceae bacterium]
MKKIEAIIRTSKFEEVHSELGKIGIAFFTFSEVKGIGTEHAATQQYRGTAYDIGFIPRTNVEIVVPNDKADAVVQCILKSAHTGKVGDGKIFVSDINEVYRIRNADKGNEAL